MDLDYLRLIVLEERDSGRLAEISRETFRDSAEYLQDLYSEAKSIDHFMTRRGSELIEEIESVKSTLQDISTLRLNKIIKLALLTVQGERTDKDEMKRMLPPEREMYEEILESVKICRSRMIETGMDASPLPLKQEEPFESPVIDDEGAAFEEEQETVPGESDVSADEAGEYEPVYLSEDIDSFMGLDGRIYTLSKEDIVMLPEKNASVLYSRNIALNIRVGK